jgi:LCP family protein required for cell wall assembly
LAPEQPVASPGVSKTITRNGVDYYPRQDITVFLILGIDEFGPVEASNSYNNKGEADVVLLAILDQTAETYSVLALNRDTMMDVRVLGLGGKYAGTYFEQLALSHTYGSGLEDSCENTKKTVSDFLNGIYIDYYLAMNMDAIGILNDAVGGVKVNVTDDFSSVDPSIKMGEMVLRGEQALHFVRLRKDVGVQLNVARMERQREYMDGFVEALRAKLDESDTFTMDVYETVSPYIVTDCSANVLSMLLNRFSEYTLQEIVSPEGENVLTQKYYEFYVDEKKLDELILRLFYVKK